MIFKKVGKCMSKLIKCPVCGHTNQPHYDQCVKCNEPLRLGGQLLVEVKPSLWSILLKSFGWMVLYLGLQIVTAGIITPMYISSIDYSKDIIEEIDRILPNAVLLSVIFSGLLFGVIYWLRYRKSHKEQPRMRTLAITPKTMVLSVVIGFAMVFVSNLILALFNPLTMMVGMDFYMEQLNLISQLISGTALPLAIVSVGIIGPIVEEVIFRGLIFYYFQKRYSVKTAIIIQAILFGVIHLNLAQASYAMIIGIFLGFAYVYTQSIWVPIIIHVVNNIVAIFVPEAIASMEAWMLVTSGVVMLLLIFVILRVMKKDGYQFRAL